MHCTRFVLWSRYYVVHIHVEGRHKMLRGVGDGGTHFGTGRTMRDLQMARAISASWTVSKTSIKYIMTIYQIMRMRDLQMACAISASLTVSLF